MPSCLGLYVETNLIKYAKVTKDKDTLKVEAFGVKFYDKISVSRNGKALFVSKEKRWNFTLGRPY